MPRTARHAPGGFIYHALNRAGAGRPLFRAKRDYETFLDVLDEALERRPIRLLSYCLMPNHWHLVLWPRKDGELTAFLRWLTHTHSMRWHSHHRTAGTGHLYQGRFKSFPVQLDDHFYHLMRYVEGNAQRSGLVKRAQDWPWGSLVIRTQGPEPQERLSAWPMPMPRDWVKQVNRPQTEAELQALRRSVNRGTPYGSPDWQQKVAKRLDLESTLRPRGRPRKAKD